MSGSGISWAICKSAPRSRQITTPAPHHSVFYRPDALPAAQPTASKHWRHSWKGSGRKNMGGGRKAAGRDRQTDRQSDGHPTVARLCSVHVAYVVKWCAPPEWSKWQCVQMTTHGRLFWWIRPRPVRYLFKSHTPRPTDHHSNYCSTVSKRPHHCCCHLRTTTTTTITTTTTSVK